MVKIRNLKHEARLMCLCLTKITQIIAKIIVLTFKAPHIVARLMCLRDPCLSYGAIQKIRDTQGCQVQKSLKGQIWP
jgi:hypothetical protein